MVHIENLTVQFGQYKVLDSLNCDFNENTIYGIVGLNGCGKSTFFNCLAGMKQPTTGAIFFRGVKLKSTDIGYLETTNFFYSTITGNEYLKLFPQTNKNFGLAALQEFLKLPLDELIETYSIGMKKKLALLGFLKQDKQIYLLDEPFNGLDLETNKLLELILIALKEKGKILLVSSHIIDPLLSICDEIRFLEKGSFTQSFQRNEYHKIEEELFGKLKAQAKLIVSESI